MSNTNVTESLNYNSLTIDEMSSLEIVQLMLEEDQAIYQGVKTTLPNVAKAVDIIVDQWNQGGNVFVVGAGTSGRLGILDATELGPTFSIESNRWQGLIAGGYKAMWEPLEQFEDDETVVIDELNKHSFNNKDVIIGISASGSTPFVISAIKYANKINAKTISISCNHDTLSSKLSDCGIEAVVGPEVIRGSTRLKAGTAQKIILNMLSTASMIRLGKVYKNQMVDMQIINQKLVKRAEQILIDILDISESEAVELLKKSNNNLKVAIFISITKADIDIAEQFLTVENGHLKNAIQKYFNN